MKNIYGVELKEEDLKNTLNIAIDLQIYGYTYKYFHDNYTSLLDKKDSRKIWEKALEINCK